LPLFLGGKARRRVEAGQADEPRVLAQRVEVAVFFQRLLVGEPGVERLLQPGEGVLRRSPEGVPPGDVVTLPGRGATPLRLLLAPAAIARSYCLDMCRQLDRPDHARPSKRFVAR